MSVIPNTILSKKSGETRGDGAGGGRLLIADPQLMFFVEILDEVGCKLLICNIQSFQLGTV